MLTQKARIQNPSVTQSSAGGAIKRWFEYTSAQSCMVNYKTGNEGHEFGRRTERGSYRIYFVPNSVTNEITRSSRIVIVGEDRTFEVVNPPYNVSKKDALLHVDCEEIL